MPMHQNRPDEAADEVREQRAGARPGEAPPSSAPPSGMATPVSAVSVERPRDGLLPTEEAVLPLSTGENFSVAARILGRETRDHLLAIYGFARLADQLGDEAPGDRLALLDRLGQGLDRVYDGEPEHPLMPRPAPTLRELDPPRGPVVRPIDANP